MKISDTRTAAARRHATLLKLSTGALALAIGSTWALPAMAQSTASQMEEIIVTGQRGPQYVGGLITPEQAAKSRSSIGQEYIGTQASGQSIIQTLNLLPGVNFVNNDPYGASGGNLRLRGFDGNRVSLTFDGIPLNDTGNYAVYTNQQLDPEIISRVNVNLGTTDVDSPTASATGGTINYVTRLPEADPSIMGKVSVGTNAFRRFFAVADTGELGPYKTKAFLAASYQEYNKFKGPGELERKQFNGRIYQPLKGDDFLSLAFHYNENRNNQYRNPTKAQYEQFGDEFEQNATYVRPTVRPGLADVDPSANDSYYQLRVNPSDTGNLRAQSKFSLTDQLTLTFDPSIQYTLANGGGTILLNERDPRLIGRATVTGRDLNGDGDVLDQVRLYSPNNTNTWRPGLNSSLIYDINDDHRVRVAYTFDYGRHRQTGEPTLLDAQGNPPNIFGGKKGTPIATADGNFIRTRDRYSVAQLNQIAGEYTGKFLDDALRVNLGLRAPFFKRELNQYCFVVERFATGQIATLNSNQYCTSAATIPTTATGTIVRAPFSATRKYDDVLPNAGVTYSFLDVHQVYASYAEGISVPRTDDLYDIQIPSSDPETTTAYDMGYRYQGERVVGSVAVWYNKFKNRIVRAFDQDLQINITRNVGSVDLWGVDAEIGVEPIDDLTFYLSGSYNHSEVKDNLRISATAFEPTKGKKLVETPEWKGSARAQYEIAGFTFGVKGSYVGSRWATDVNDEKSDAYFVLDADVSYDISNFIGEEGSEVRLNLDNILDEKYLGNISSRTRALGAGGSAPTYSVGAPFIAQVSVSLKF